MKIIVLVLAVVAIAVTAIAAFAPASLADARLASLSNGTLRLAEARGTLWQGRGLLASPDGRWRIPIEWQLKPQALFAGVASIELRMPEKAPYGVSGLLALDEHRTVAERLRLRSPASVIASIPGSMVLDAGGDLELRSDALALGLDAQSQSSGVATVQWRNARIATSGVASIDLGTLTSQLSAGGNAWSGPVSGSGGTIGVAGNVSISADRLAANLRLKPETGAPAEVVNALERLGPADANGAFALRVDHRIR